MFHKKPLWVYAFVFLIAFVFLMPLAGRAMAGSDVSSKAAAMLAPHRAVYEIKLATNKSGSPVVNIAGDMAYEWQPSCDAWITKHSFNLRYEYPDLPPMRVESSFSNYESFDGKTFNFTSQRKTNGAVFEELRGSATLAGAGKPAQAVYTIPEGLVFEMPQDALFPMAHTLAVLGKIKEKQKFFTATIFDGSDKEGPVEINTFIGKEMPVPEALKTMEGVDQSLLTSPLRKVRLAFFPLNKPESEADYEMDLALHENGVVSDLMVDYGKYSVVHKLKSLEVLADSCHGGAADAVKKP